MLAMRESSSGDPMESLDDDEPRYPPYNAGNDTGSYLLNPDGSLYIGDVWPGFVRRLPPK